MTACGEVATWKITAGKQVVYCCNKCREGVLARMEFPVAEVSYEGGLCEVKT